METNTRHEIKKFRRQLFWMIVILSVGHTGNTILMYVTQHRIPLITLLIGIATILTALYYRQILKKHEH